MLFEPRVNLIFFTHLRFKKSWSTSKKGKSPGGSSETPPKPPPNHHHHHRFAFAATSLLQLAEARLTSSLPRALDVRATEVGSTLSSDSRHITGRILNEIYREKQTHVYLRSILPGAMGFFVQNECLSTKVWERPVLPVVISQSQYLAASKFLKGFLPCYWSPSENPTTKRPNPTSELCVDEEQSTSEAHAKASIRFFIEFPTPWKINIKQTQKWRFGSNTFPFLFGVFGWTSRSQKNRLPQKPRFRQPKIRCQSPLRGIPFLKAFVFDPWKASPKKGGQG